MPELPDITLYLDALEERLVGESLRGVRLKSPFLLRTVEPPLRELSDRPVTGVRRLGKRIVIELEGSYFLVLHLMIAGRLKWRPAGAGLPGKIGLAAFDFTSGTLILTEAGTQRRASLHVMAGESAFGQLDPGGLEVMGCTREAFQEVLLRENHTLKRSLTDPHLFSGIGNAYSDEILHRARLSPIGWTSRLDAEEQARLHAATEAVLQEWIDRLRQATGTKFPEKVTAFRPEMAVHGKYGEACPDCGTVVQRIVYAQTETNYCPGCQTGGKLLADRSLSKLLGRDWPKTFEELEERRGGSSTRGD